MHRSVRLWTCTIPFAILLAACGGSGASAGQVDDSEVPENQAESTRQAIYAERGADDDGANADPSTVDANDVEDTHEYTCTEDCSGHEAGFSWAQDQDITDAADCGGDSQSFTEGCEAFAEARQEQADASAQDAADAAEVEADDAQDAE